MMPSSERVLIVDLDDTITIHSSSSKYENKKPNSALICKLKEYHSQGFKIVIYTARNMKSFNGNIGQINIYTLPIIIEWLKKHKVPYDEILVGKPYCGEHGFYIDDKAIRPDEFVNSTIEELYKITKRKAE